MDEKTEKIAVIGLGYVGLPLAVALAKHFEVIGYDQNQERVAALRQGQDWTAAVTAEALQASALKVFEDPSEMAEASVFIITVPTPVDADNRPDLSAVRAASESVGRVLRPGGLVIYESTVYPGVTEEVCGPLLEAASGLRSGDDFSLGYSPERINPGDQSHSIEKITKVISGQTPDAVERMRRIYGAVTGGNLFVARDIKTAEAAKVIENAQRDINIAFINEAAMIFHKLGLSTHDVLAAAKTKWNFLDFSPGLVGGHCIGVDPYYLAYRAAEVGHDPEIILAGRRINDSMGGYLGEQITAALQTEGPILVLGLTFKENVPDLRNSRVPDLVAALQAAGREIAVHDPQADPAEAKRLYGLDLLPDLAGARYAAVVGAVAHESYRRLTLEALEALLLPGGLVVDIKGLWRTLELSSRLRSWTL